MSPHRAPLSALLALAACTGGLATTDKNTVPSDGSSDSDACRGCDSTDTTDSDTDTDADTDSDTDADSDTDTDTDTTPTGPWSRGIAVDGDTSDVPAGAWFPTTGGRTGLTWDGSNLYVALEHPDLGASASHWVVVTVGDGGPGADAGITHGTQTPLVGFGATRVLRFKADDSFESVLDWDGSAWVDSPGALRASGALAVNGGADRAELSIPFSRLGVGRTFAIHVDLVYEGVGSESTYAPTPADAFADGYDPDYGTHYVFDRDLEQAPDAYRSTAGVFPPPDTGHTGETGAPPHTGDSGGPPPGYSFTPAIDGAVGEWPADSRFTSSAGSVVRFGWDATDVHLAVTHPDVATGGAQHWIVIAVGPGTDGSLDGPGLGTQVPTLPFEASHVLRIKADGSYDDLQSWNGATWDTTAGAVSRKAESGDTLELSFARGDLGLTDTWDVLVTQVFEGAGSESTYAAVPASAITDGAYDPDPATFLRFDLGSEPGLGVIRP